VPLLPLLLPPPPPLLLLASLILTGYLGWWPSF